MSNKMNDERSDEMSDEVDDIKQRLERFARSRVTEEIIQYCRNNEGQTTDSLVKPFLNEVLGWDVSDPVQVRREYTVSDLRPNESADFALMVNSQPAILIEVKSTEKTSNLLSNRRIFKEMLNQLNRYIKDTDGQTRLGILTTGLIWQWHVCPVGSENNLLDNDPVHRLDLSHPKVASVEWLHYVSRPHFVPDNVHVEAAIERLRQEMREPSDRFCQMIVKASGLPVPLPYPDRLITATRSLIQKQTDVAETRPSPSTRPKPSASVPVVAPSRSMYSIQYPHAIQVYKDVLIWLARRHDAGPQDWASILTDRWPKYFSQDPDGPPSQEWITIDIGTTRPFHVKKHMSNQRKTNNLKAIISLTVHQDKPLVLGQDIHVDMPKNSKTSPATDDVDSASSRNG